MPKIFKLLLNSSKGFAAVPALVLFMVVVGIGVGLVLIQRSVVFSPKAYLEEEITVTSGPATSPRPAPRVVTEMPKLIGEIGQDSAKETKIWSLHGTSCGLDAGGSNACEKGYTDLTCSDTREGYTCRFPSEKSREYGDLCFIGFECKNYNGGINPIPNYPNTWCVKREEPIAGMGKISDSLLETAKLKGIDPLGRCLGRLLELGSSCNFDFECAQKVPDSSGNLWDGQVECRGVTSDKSGICTPLTQP